MYFCLSVFLSIHFCLSFSRILSLFPFTSPALFFLDEPQVPYSLFPFTSPALFFPGKPQVPYSLSFPLRPRLFFFPGKPQVLYSLSFPLRLRLFFFFQVSLRFRPLHRRYRQHSAPGTALIRHLTNCSPDPAGRREDICLVSPPSLPPWLPTAQPSHYQPGGDICPSHCLS